SDFGLQLYCRFLLIGGLLRFELLFKSRFCFRCVLLFSFKAGSSSSTQTGSTTGEPGSVWVGCYRISV
ncbi:hypothetical protein LINPERPRIM_LOCUS25069, partial [Linum perenne]